MSKCRTSESHIVAFFGPSRNYGIHQFTYQGDLPSPRHWSGDWEIATVYTTCSRSPINVWVAPASRSAPAFKKLWALLGRSGAKAPQYIKNSTRTTTFFLCLLFFPLYCCYKPISSIHQLISLLSHCFSPMHRHHLIQVIYPSSPHQTEVCLFRNTHVSAWF